MSLFTEGGQINNNVGPASNMGQQHPYPALGQLSHVYEQHQQQQQLHQQQQQQQQNKDLNKYASLKAVGEWLPSFFFFLVEGSLDEGEYFYSLW